MKSLISNILPSTDRSKNIEVRLFEITLALTSVVFLFWSVYGFIVGYKSFVLTIYSSGFIIYTILYVLQKKGLSFRGLSLTYYYLILVILGIAWLPSGGIKAAMPTFLLLVYLSGLLVLPLKDFLLFIAVTIGLVFGLTVFEINQPSIVAPYSSAAQLTQDLTIATLLSLAIVGICLYVFKSESLRDREELRRRNLELEREKLNAESTDKAKTTFLATISHEMRTPLNGIVGMTELLSKTDIDEEQKDLINSLSYSSNILHDLIRNVLDITIIEAGKLELSMSSFSSHDELHAIWNVFTKKVKNNPKLEIKLLVDDELPAYLNGDIRRIRQVLVNLLNNAIKFTWKGSITLNVQVAGQTGDVASIRFSIEDTGVGIPVEKQKQLFETFYKASDQDGYEGSGLGLSIVEKLVKLMGGEISFTSTPGKGSTFSFTIPLGIADPGEFVPQSLDIPGLEDLKILIVEDVAINRMVAEKMLKKMDIKKVDLAVNGTEGVQKATENFYDVIFMDLQMPDISGFEASSQISKRYAENDQKPVIIALTANAMKNSLEACKEVGMSDHILKPLKSEKLKQVLFKYTTK